MKRSTYRPCMKNYPLGGGPEWDGIPHPRKNENDPHADEKRQIARDDAADKKRS